MQAVNLLPAYARPAGRWTTIGKELSPTSVTRVGGIVAAACALAIAGLYFYERSVVNNRRATLSDAQARLTAVEATAAPLRTAVAASTTHATVIRTVVSQRVAWESVLRDLARVLPDQVQLQSLAASTPLPALAASTPLPAAGTPAVATSTGGTSFSITGTTTSHVRVALVLDRLALAPWLSGITLTSSSRGTAGDQFTITATFQRTGSAAQ
jgi:Tfp pilus assembly protein PilN